MPPMNAAILPDRNAPLVVDQVTLEAPPAGEVNRAFDDLKNGAHLRGVLVHP